MSLTGTRKDPFLLHDSLPLNNIRRVHIPSSYFSPILPLLFSYFLIYLTLPSTLAFVWQKEKNPAEV